MPEIPLRRRLRPVSTPAACMAVVLHLAWPQSAQACWSVAAGARASFCSALAATPTRTLFYVFGEGSSFLLAATNPGHQAPAIAGLTASSLAMLYAALPDLHWPGRPGTPTAAAGASSEFIGKLAAAGGLSVMATSQYYPAVSINWMALLTTPVFLVNDRVVRPLRFRQFQNPHAAYAQTSLIKLVGNIGTVSWGWHLSQLVHGQGNPYVVNNEYSPFQSIHMDFWEKNAATLVSRPVREICIWAVAANLPVYAAQEGSFAPCYALWQGTRTVTRLLVPSPEYRALMNQSWPGYVELAGWELYTLWWQAGVEILRDKHPWQSVMQHARPFAPAAAAHVAGPPLPPGNEHALEMTIFEHKQAAPDEHLGPVTIHTGRRNIPSYLSADEVGERKGRGGAD